MLKKLTEKQQEDLLSAATSEFGENGLSGAVVSKISKRAGVSVGVIYKYYKDKEALFDACLKRSLTVLQQTVEDSISESENLDDVIGKLIRALQNFSRKEPDSIRMYHTITTVSNPLTAKRLADEIEGATAGIYSEIIQKAEESGVICKTADPRAFAFFFDNLLMMLHFSYSCEYYKKRFEIYFGKDATDIKNDAAIEGLMTDFIKNALGVKR